MGKPVHILALLGLFSMGRAEPTLVITKTTGGTAKPVVSGVTVKVGMNVTLACTVVDGPEEKVDDVVWSKRTYDSSRFQPKKMLKPHKDSIVSTSKPSKLQFLSVTIQHRGTYICSDAAHTKSKSVFVTVKPRKDSVNKPNHNVHYPESASPNDPDYVLRELLQDSFNKQDASKVLTSKPSILNNSSIFDWKNPRNNGEPFLKPAGSNYEDILKELRQNILDASKVSISSISKPSVVDNPPMFNWNNPRNNGQPFIKPAGSNYDDILKKLRENPFDKLYGSKFSTSKPYVVNPSVIDRSHLRDDGPFQIKHAGNNPNYDNVLEELLHDSLNKLNGSKFSTSEPPAFNKPPVIDWSRLGANKWSSVPEWAYSDTDKPPNFDFDFPISNYTFPELKYDDLIDSSNGSTYDYKSSFWDFSYTGAVLILFVVVGILRLCCFVVKRTNRGWQRLTAARAACSHRVCTNQRTTNPSAGCLLEERGAGRLSVLIVNRMTPIAAASERTNNAVQDDAPPSYDDSTRNPESGCSELPPSYNEALATISSNSAANLHEAADSASVAAPDVLPMPHSGSIQQRV